MIMIIIIIVIIIIIIIIIIILPKNVNPIEKPITWLQNEHFLQIEKIINQSLFV